MHTVWPVIGNVIWSLVFIFGVANFIFFMWNMMVNVADKDNRHRLKWTLPIQLILVLTFYGLILLHAANNCHLWYTMSCPDIPSERPYYNP